MARRSQRTPGDGVILCRGCFDLLHVGHIRHLQQARELGSKLIVALTEDEFVNKGPDRPVFTFQLRRAALLALRCVDQCVAGLGPTAVEDILLYRPALFVKGPECRMSQSPGLIAEIKAIRSIGGDIAYTDGVVFSSTELLRKVMSYG